MISVCMLQHVLSSCSKDMHEVRKFTTGCSFFKIPNLKTQNIGGIKIIQVMLQHVELFKI
jgi:hypothetical protein